METDRKYFMRHIKQIANATLTYELNTISNVTSKNLKKEE